MVADASALRRAWAGDAAPIVSADTAIVSATADFATPNADRRGHATSEFTESTDNTGNP